MMENGFGKKESTFSSVDTFVDTLKSCKTERMKDDSGKSESRKSESSNMKEKHLTGFFKNSFKTLSMPKKAAPEKAVKTKTFMQTLRKKTSPCKYKNEPSRFLGEGVTFKAKLIGILEVEEARGDKMCQESLLELKMAVRAAGEHKQRINIVIAIDGIRLRDEKTGDCLHHHPVHKISFIAQDMADSRAFGYIFGSPDTSHRFFGIKTDKAASQVVMTMRDLFQAVYELKKREVEMAKQNIEQHQLKYGSSFLLDSGPNFPLKNTSTDQTTRLKQVTREEPNKNPKSKTQTTSVIADLMDLELELNSLQQGLSQMERLTPSDPFGPSPSLQKEDPFGDSFTPPPCITTPPPAKLPPPPASGDRRKVSGSTSSAPAQPELHWFDKETRDLFSSEKSLTSTKEDKDERDPVESKSTSSRDLYDIFVELDPLGTGRNKPYTDKKDFFQELKNPPKKQLRDLRGREADGGYAATSSKPSYSEEVERRHEDHLRKYRSVDSDQRFTLTEELAKREDANSDPFETSFANFASFDRGVNRSPASFGAVPRRSPQSHLCQPSPPIHSETHAYSLGASTLRSSSNSSKSVYKSLTSGDDVDSPSSHTNDAFASRRSPQWGRLHEDTSKQKIIIDLRKVLSNMDDTDKENDSPVAEEMMILRNPDIQSPGTGGNVSSDSFESIPEPPPRPITSPMISQPPPLPPKKLQLPVTLKPPPPRPSSDTTSHYDYIENYESVGSRQTSRNGNVQIPPLPAPARKPKFSHHDYDHRDFVRHRPQKQHSGSSVASVDSDYYLTPISKSRVDKHDERGNVKHSKPSLNITISQLTSSGFEDLASILRIPASALSKMTLKELTECLSRLTEAECQKLERDMSRRNRGREDMAGLRYRSMNESFDEDTSTASTFKVNFDEKFPQKSSAALTGPSSAPPQIDKYAVFRELIDQEQTSLFTTASQESFDSSEHKQTTNPESDSAADKNVDDAKGAGLSERFDSPRSVEEKDDDRKESESDVAVERDANVETEGAVNSSGVVSDNSSPVGRQFSKQDEIPSSKAETEPSSDVEKQPTEAMSPATEQETQKTEENKSNRAEKVESHNEVEPPASTGVGKNWAIFDSEQDTKSDSLWQSDSKETDAKTQHVKRKEPVTSRAGWQEYDDEDDEEGEVDYRGEDGDGLIQAEEEENELEEDGNEDDYGDDSEENWEGSKKSPASSWDESSWRENGWSDRDSLYDEGDVLPAARYRDQQRYPTNRRGHHRRPPPHHMKSASQSPWDEEPGGWSASRRRNAPSYRDYAEGERIYDSRKVLTPERKKRYDPKEEDELILLKMMLGKKRLKALEEQLFNHYQEQLSEKAVNHPTSKRYPSKTKGSSSSLLFDRQYDELGAGGKGTMGRRVAGRKYYHTQMRPKSAEKGSRPLLLRAEDAEELYASSTKGRYRKPNSQDELSISEEDRWSRTSPTSAGTFKTATSRSRQHSQNSPFEDNFAVSATGEDIKLANTSVATVTTATSSLSTASSLRSKNPQPVRYSSTSKTLTAGASAYASCDNLKYGRSSRDSSQRQSPFEDDFTPSDVQREDSTECVERRRQNDDVFFNNGVTSPSRSAGLSTSLVVEPGNRKARSARCGGRAAEQSRRTSSETSHNSGKYYENVELWKKKSPSEVFCPVKERHRKEMEAAVASPKKGKRGSGSETSKRHDPFNDYESRTVPRFGSKAKSKTRSTNYDSDSDSAELGGDANAFSDQHSRK